MELKIDKNVLFFRRPRIDKCQSKYSAQNETVLCVHACIYMA